MKLSFSNPAISSSLKGRPMKADGGHIRILCFCIGAIAIQISGCTVGTKSFSMDSVSRMPFFGLELWERKPKSSGPAFREIRRSIDDKPYFETAVGIGKSTARKRESMIAQVDRAATPVAKPIEPPAKVATGTRALAFPSDNKHGSNSMLSEPAGFVDFN